eukprot:Amastigsp_a853573_4.p3 type:complete len:128 gc:universal Amastigsp_a853573_4:745-1128(+)
MRSSVKSSGTVACCSAMSSSSSTEMWCQLERAESPCALHESTISCALDSMKASRSWVMSATSAHIAERNSGLRDAIGDGSRVVVASRDWAQCTALSAAVLSRSFRRRSRARNATTVTARTICASNAS